MSRVAALAGLDTAKAGCTRSTFKLLLTVRILKFFFDNEAIS